MADRVEENITFYDKNTGRDAVRAYLVSGSEKNNSLSELKCKNQQIYQLVSRKKTNFVLIIQNCT